jgi:predicted dehydrogenase
VTGSERTRLPRPERLRVAVVGCGDIAPLHLDAIAADPLAELVVVCDVDPTRVRTTATVRECAAETDFAVMLDRHRPDVVHVCTPHHLHAPMAVECLSRGIHVLVEKPLADTVEAGRSMVAAAAASSAALGVCFQNRYNTTSLAMHEILAGGEFGAPVAARAVVTWFRDAGYYAASPWRGQWSTAGGGVLMNQAIHTLDLVLAAMGPAVEITGHADRLALGEQIQVEDTATIRLTHAGSGVSVLYATVGYAANAPVLLEVVTSGGATLRLDGDLTVLAPDGSSRVVPETLLGSGARSYWGAAHGTLVADFYDHLRTGRRFPIDAAAGLPTLQVIDEVYRRSGPLRSST